MAKDQVAERICPVCRGRLTEKRNLDMERLLEKIPKKKCKHQSCSFSRSEKELVTEHEGNCPEREVKCAYCPAQTGTKSMSSIHDHLITVHNKEVPNFTMNKWHCGGNSLVPKTGCDVYMLPWKADNISILFNKVWVDKDYCLMWVSVLGTKEEAESLEYSLRIYNMRDRNAVKKNYLFWGTMKSVPCDISHEEMKKERIGCGLARKLLEKACEGNNDRKQ